MSLWPLKINHMLSGIVLGTNRVAQARIHEQLYYEARYVSCRKSVRYMVKDTCQLEGDRVQLSQPGFFPSASDTVMICRGTITCRAPPAFSVRRSVRAAAEPPKARVTKEYREGDESVTGYTPLLQSQFTPQPVHTQRLSTDSCDRGCPFLPLHALTPHFMMRRNESRRDSGVQSSGTYLCLPLILPPRYRSTGCEVVF